MFRLWNYVSAGRVLLCMYLEYNMSVIGLVLGSSLGDRANYDELAVVLFLSPCTSAVCVTSSMWPLEPVQLPIVLSILLRLLESVESTILGVFTH